MKLNNIILLAFVIVFTSCTKSFFDLKPADKVITDQVYKTSDDFNRAVIGAYSKLTTQMSYYTDLCEYRSDNLNLSAPTAGTQDRYDIDHFLDKPSNGILFSMWINLDNNVYRCNMILDKIENAKIPEHLKNQYKGEALFLRSLAYFNKYRVWGGVPVTKKVVTVEQAMKIKRLSNDEMLKSFEEDLLPVIKNHYLPKSYDSDNLGRATEGAAIMLMAKIYLTYHKWQECIDLLEPLVGQYELLPNIASVFDVNNKMNKEIIFAIRYNKDFQGQGHGYWYNISNLSDDNNQGTHLLQGFDNNDSRLNLLKYKKAVKNVYLLNKFFDIQNPTYKSVGNDFIVFRYSDVLLMLSEAYNELGSNQAKAIEYLNMVRHRAGIPNITESDFDSKDKFREIVAEERRKEFPYEGQRWFDLVRMGLAKSALQHDGITINDYQFVYPIPQKEIEKINDNSILWQNPGYGNN